MKEVFWVRKYIFMKLGVLEESVAIYLVLMRRFVRGGVYYYYLLFVCLFVVAQRCVHDLAKQK
jgi:hypothetical protein